MINPLGGRCVVLILRAILPIFKEGSTLYMGARTSKFLWLLGINEKIICSKSQVSTFTGSRNKGLKPALFLARADFSVMNVIFKSEDMISKYDY